MTRMWPVRPAPMEGETFSSWFTRLAAGNGLRPKELYSLCVPGGSLSDLDRHADQVLLHVLAEHTGIASEHIQACTFRALAGRAFEQDEDGRNTLPWLPPAGRFNGKRCFGQQACPICLTTDHTPFLRLPWRFGFVTCCPVHTVLLVDRCPDCQAPLSTLQQHTTGFRCWACGSHPKTWRPEPLIVKDSGAVQDGWLNIIHTGWTALGKYGPVYSFVALEILALVARLLTGGEHAYPLRSWVAKHWDGPEVSPSTIPRVRDTALLPPHSRTIIVAMANWLMQDWPMRFIDAGKAAGLASSHIRKRHNERQPFAFADPIYWHLHAEQRTGDREEIRSARQVLSARGETASYRNMVEMVGTRLTAITEVAEPTVIGAAWGKGRYWKLDGVSAEVKAAAREAAHKAGLGVGQWIDLILRDELKIVWNGQRSNQRNFRSG